MKSFCNLGLPYIKEHLPDDNEALTTTHNCSNASDKEDFFSSMKHLHTQETAGFISGMHSWESGHFDTIPNGIKPVAQVKHSTAHFCCLPKTFKCSQIDLQPTKGKNWFIQLRKSSFYLSWIRTFSTLNSSIRLLILTTRDYVSHYLKSRVQSTVPLEGFSNQLCTLDEFFFFFSLVVTSQ